MEKLGETQCKVATPYIKSLKATVSLEILTKIAHDGDATAQKIENAYQSFKAGLKDIRRGKLNYFYVKLVPCALPFAWHCKNKAIKRGGVIAPDWILANFSNFIDKMVGNFHGMCYNICKG